MNCANNGDRIVKSMAISGCGVLALIDTGCIINICRQSFWSKISNMKSTVSQLRHLGPAGANFCTERKVDVELYVDGRTYPITMYIVSDSDSYDVTIGKSLF